MATGRPLAMRCVLAASCLLLALCLAGTPAAAWDNAETHPMINRAAVERFLRQVEFEEWWRNCSFSDMTPLGRQVMETGLFDRREELNKMTIRDWLAHGGYSADTPELPQSFRHFYDPVRLAGVSYLTDHLDDVLEFGWGIGRVAVKGVDWIVSLPDTENPKTDARHWALTHPDNPYSLAMAVSYFRDAVGKDPLIAADREFVGWPEYGMAWRAVGETMHLMADMVMPAHVRNDSHPYLEVRSLKFGNPDLLESTTFGRETELYLTFTPSPSIDYRTTDLNTLFHDVATWTNANFFSCDTIPMTGTSGKTMNGQPEYSLPVLPAEHDGRYFYSYVDGIRMPIAATSLLHRLNVLSAQAVSTQAPDFGFPLAKLDMGVLEGYRARTIPTAVEACAQVLDRFLPRFTVEVEAEPGAEDQGGFDIRGKLIHTATAMWSSMPEVRNGAFITLEPKSGSPATIWLPADAYKPGSAVAYALPQAQPGDEIVLGWDLGGYRIESDPLELKGLAVTINPERIGDAEPDEELMFLARATDIPATVGMVRFVWKSADKVLAESGWLIPVDGETHHICRSEFSAEGSYEIKVELLARTKPEAALASATSSVIVAEPRVEAVISPRPTQAQSNVEVRFVAYPAGRYTYRWDFGDGTTHSADVPGTTHIFRKEGTVTVKLEIVTPPDRGAKVVGQDSLTIRVAKDITHCLCGLHHDYSELTKVDTGKAVWYEDAAKVKQGVHITWWSAEDREAGLKASMGCNKDGRRHGLWLRWHSTGPASATRSTGILSEEIYYADGKKHGPYARYTTTGQPIQIGQYENDRTAGHWKQYSSGVLSAEGRLDEELNRQGVWHFYDSRGHLTRISFHVDNLLHGKSVVYRTFTEAGETRVGMSAVEYYIAGVKHGPYVGYVPQTGQVASEGGYFEGKEHGAWTYYSSGVLTHTGQWHHGKRAGTWIYYRPDGSELRREELGTL